MAVLIVQISDIHFAGASDRTADRAHALKQAIVAKVPMADACFLVLTGDIANSGAPEEYDVASHFINDLRAGLIESGIGVVEVVAVPGNHDLNLRAETDTRQSVLESPEAYLNRGVNLDGLNFEAIIEVQDDFFRFEASISGQAPLKKSERLYYRRTYQVGNLSFLFHCFNTAWLSRQHEIQAKLFLPPQILTGDTPPETTMSVALFHHPYNWLNTNNHHLLKSFVESLADVVLMGHEHEAGADRYLSMKGQGLDYLAAPAFNDQNIQSNGFQMLVVNFELEEQHIFLFEWDGIRFTETNSTTWTLHRNSSRQANPFNLRPEFFKVLHDMGTGFRHPRCVPPQCELRLRDLYVYPDIMHHRLDKVGDRNSSPAERIPANNLPEFLEKHPRILVFGADDCGKTALAHILYEDLTNKGIHPVLIMGEKLRGIVLDSTLVKVISSAVIEQYATSSSEAYLQAETDRTAILIDGFENAKLSREAQGKLLVLLQRRFHTIFVLASDLFQVQDIAASTENNPFKGFERCTIREFGRFHRQKLIRMWLSLGLESSEEIDHIEKRVLQTDKTISTLLGKNVLPHFPVTILTLLQILDSKESTNTANGAYGYMYEVLLKSALASVNPKDVDEKITYISFIGYSMFSARQPALSEEDIRKVHDNYCTRYDMNRDFLKMVSDLVNAEVLVESKGVFRFKYPYEYYYSTAKYFQDHSASMRGELFAIADHIYGEANANVLIFYVYLTKDEDLIRHIIENAKHIYSRYKPCDMEKDVEFINKIIKTTPPPLVLEYGSASEHRDELNRKQDEVGQDIFPFVGDDIEISYDDRLQDIVKIAIGFKTLQTLGQVLRNFTGSIEGPLKFEITMECYSLGRRLLTAVLTIASFDIDAMRQYLGGLISERSGITDSKELAVKTDEAIVWLGVAAAFGSVKRISYAVGHSDLTNTYNRVLEKATDLATRIIDTVIKLDHFDHPPEKELNDLAPRLKKNPFAYNVMRDIVADYLYLYNVEYQTMQRLGQKWEIAISPPKYLLNRSKK
jgi:hypothetical protein